MLVPQLIKLLENEIKDNRVSFRPFEIPDVKVEERVRLKCMVPPCPDYGRRKFCPPNLPDLDFIRKAISQYQGGVLVCLTIPFSTGVMDEVKQFEPHLELMNIIGQCEKIACEKVNHLAFGLTVGGCNLCQECTPNGEPCRHPLKTRPGADGFGIDITTLARKLGINIEWPVQTELNFLGMIFV